MLITQVFIVSSIVNVSDNAKCIFLHHQQGMA